MKKILLFVFTIILSLSLAACSTDANGNMEDNSVMPENTHHVTTMPKEEVVEEELPDEPVIVYFENEEIAITSMTDPFLREEAALLGYDSSTLVAGEVNASALGFWRYRNLDDVNDPSDEDNNWNTYFTVNCIFMDGEVQIGNMIQRFQPRLKITNLTCTVANDHRYLLPDGSGFTALGKAELLKMLYELPLVPDNDADIQAVMDNAFR